MTIVVFEDSRTTGLYPITVGRPALAITCGGYRLVDHLLGLGETVRASVRPYLRSIVEVDFPELVGPLPTTGSLMLVNARLVPSMHARRTLAQLLTCGQTGVVRQGGDVVLALLDVSAAEAFGSGHHERIERLTIDQPDLPVACDLPLFEYPHDVVRQHLEIIGENLEQRLREQSYREVRDGVFLAADAHLSEPAVTHTQAGPVLIDREASIGPYCLLEGPAYIGPKARVIEHAAIKDCVAIGHTTKIGGEVEASIIEPFTNKQHHGFLGHSYLGSWINLGAGTCNSDLKNTYGHVKMEYHGEKVPTGMQFLGAIVGDYAKTAINTGIFTGKTVGACSMVYGFVTTNVPSFVNYARLFGQVTATPVEVMVATQARMFARRQITQRPCDIQLLHDMFDLTRSERELGSVPPEPLSL